jgi:DtxR family Mn-dependent transcriptional regulator
VPDPLHSLLIAAAVTLVAAGLLWPDRGLWARWRSGRRHGDRVRIEDALKHIHKCRMGGVRPTLQSVAGALNVHVNEAADLVNRMENQGLLLLEENSFQLTPEGRESALHIIRAHRLWERYLADRTGYSESEWHDQAERFEHTVSASEADALARALGDPTHDPHGDPIPTAAGELVSHGGRPLHTMKQGDRLRIVHIEDEPEAVYAQLVAERLQPGMFVQVLEATPQRIRIWADGNEHVLAPIVAANVSVVPLRDEEPEEIRDEERLTALRPGECGRVLRISRACRGPERRRLMDLGFLKGTEIRAELQSPSGDPIAFRVRGTLIALHREQAELVHIERLEQPEVVS